MKFDELDAQMRVFETLNDHCVLPGIFIVARIDGRSFTRLTKEVQRFESPFDERFRDLMVATTKHLMSCGFQVIYGYTQSDEISLLFHPAVDAFGRKERKYTSVLAGEASARFSLLLGAHACFDCRLCELPRAEHVRDYFRWRNEDAHRNALNAHCYWTLRKQGIGATQATATLEGMSVAEKNELLFQNGINFNDLPAWQKRGIGLTWGIVEKDATNLQTGEPVIAKRRTIEVNYVLPARDAYSAFIMDLLGSATSSPPAA